MQESVGNIVFTFARDRSVDAQFLHRLVRALSDCGAEVRCMELTCSETELEQRVASSHRASFGKVHHVARLRELRAAGAFPLFSLPADTVSIDTSGLTGQQAAALVDAWRPAT